MTQRLRSKIRTALGKKNKSAKKNSNGKTLPDNVSKTEHDVTNDGVKNGDVIKKDEDTTKRGVADEADEVDEASMESFPASDAPSWTPVASTGAGAGNKEKNKSVNDDNAPNDTKEPNR